MSHYSLVSIEISDTHSLVAALEELVPRWAGHVEVHSEPVSLYGYHNDVRPEKADVVIRRQHVSGSSNDIGFVRDPQTGKYRAIVSDYDQSIGFNRGWLGKVTQYYGKHVAIQQAERDGMTVVSSKIRNDGSLELVLES